MLTFLGIMLVLIMSIIIAFSKKQRLIYAILLGIALIMIWGGIL